MDFELPPDPYAALGVTKDSSSAEIKKAWQKLVLKCHPDKVSEPEAKEKANEEFHKVQSAYELISEESGRKRYDAQARIFELKKQNEQLRGNQGGRFDTRAAGFDVRTAAPSQDRSYASRGPSQYHAEERRPTYFEDDEPLRGSTRKYDAAEYVYARRGPPPKERDRDRVRPERVRVSAEERRRTERRRDVDLNDSRARKYETRAEDYAQYEDERRRRDSDDERKKSSEGPRPTLKREDPYDRTKVQQEEAMRYMAAKNIVEEARPSSYRTSSSREPRYDYVRRSSAEMKDSRRSHEATRDSPPRDSKPKRRSHEASDVYEARPPTLRQFSSAPPKVPVTEAPQPYRSNTTHGDYERRRAENEPPSMASRSATMPSVPRSSKTQPSQPSKLRASESAINADSGYSSPVSPDKAGASYPIPPPPPLPSNMSRTTYRYPAEDAYSNGHRVEVRAPPAANSSARRVTRSPSPMQEREPEVKPSATAAKMANLASGSPRARSGAFAPYGEDSSSRPSFVPASSSREIPRSTRSPEPMRERERGHDRRERQPRERLYGEVSEGRYRGQPAAGGVIYSKQYTNNDVIYSAGEKARERYEDRGRPSMSRSSTTVY